MDSSNRASSVFRSLWKGQDRLVGAQGRFRIEVYLQKLEALDWRSLGSLLVQLSKPLEQLLAFKKHGINEQQEQQRGPSIVRCTVALAVTLSHMQALEAKEAVTPVNSKFVTSVFATLVQATRWVYVMHSNEYHLAAHHTFKAISTVLASARSHGATGQLVKPLEQRFACDAVLDGILGPGEKDERADVPRQSAKRRRTDAGDGNGTVGHAELLQMLVSALSIRTDMRTDRYVVRILRLQSGAVIGRVLGHRDSISTAEQYPVFGADVAKQLLALVGGLAGRCSSVLHDESSSSKKEMESDDYIGGLFACIRDILPLVHMDYVRDKVSLETTEQLLSLVTQLAIDLASLFGPLVLFANSSISADDEKFSVYSYCTRKKHRCYQWAALCRVATWISCWGLLSATSHQMREACNEAVAECGRVCWLQSFHAELYLSSAEPSIWLLLLSESLHHMALDSPHLRTKSGLCKPPFTLSENSQTQVFSLVAALLSAIGPRLDQMIEQNASRALLLDLMAVCDKIVCLVRPRAASMGLFEPQTVASIYSVMYKHKGRNNFKSFVGSPAEYICSPVPLASTSLVGKSALDTVNNNVDWSQQRQKDIVDDSVAELQREAFEEIIHETRIAGVFAALDKIIFSVASLDQSEKGSGVRNALSMPFRVVLRWTSLFATSARNNANYQADILDGRKRVNIRLVGDRVRLNKSATDWSRLQRIPILRIDSDIHPTEQVIEEQSLDRYATAFAASPDTAAADLQDGADLGTQEEELSRQEDATYGLMMARILRFLITMSVYKLLAENCQSTLERCLIWPDNRITALNNDRHKSNLGSKNMVDLCQKLEDLLSDADFDSSAFHSLQIISSIVGVRSHLYTSDMMELRMPHTYLRNHSPRSNEALVQMAMSIGLCRLLLEPTFIVRSLQGIRSNQFLKHPRLVCAVQIWLDMIGNIVRHSLFRSYLGIGSIPRAMAKTSSSASSTSSVPMPLIPFSVWWSLAISASTRCMLDVLQSAENSTERDWERMRMLCVLPSHLMSWHLYVPMAEKSVRQMSCLKHGGPSIPADFADKVSLKSDTDQLFKWLSLFKHPERSKSVVFIIYYLATRLWLDIPLLSSSDTCHQQNMRICKDIWGIVSDSLQFLVRFIQQSTPWQDFVSLGLVDDFAQVLKVLFTRKDMPSLILHLISKQYTASESGQKDSDALLAVSESEQYSETDNNSLLAAEPSKAFTADDLVGRLLYESSLRHGSASKRKSGSDFYSKRTMAKLWSLYIDNLLRFAVAVILNASSNKILDGSAPLALFVGGSGNNSNTSAGVDSSGGTAGSTTSIGASTNFSNSSSGGLRGSVSSIKVNVRDWLCDKSSIPFDMLLPLLDAKEALSKPNAMWSLLETVFPMSQIAWAINGVEKASFTQACMSAALVMPDISASRPRAFATEGAIKSIFLLISQHIIDNNDRGGGDDSRYSKILLFLVWRQLPVFLQKIEICAAQLKNNVICVAKQLGALDLTELAAAFGLQNGLPRPSSSPERRNPDLLFLSGNDREAAQPLVTTSVSLLVEHSPVFAAMLTGDFSEAQTLLQKQQAQLTLQRSHNVLAGLFDIFHRLALLLHPTPDAQWESEVPDLISAFAMDVSQTYSLEDQAAILDTATYYELRPLVVFLIWNIISQTASGTAIPASVLEVLAALLSEEWGSFFGDDEESVWSVRRSLSALLLLHFDKLDFAGTIGQSIDMFVDCLSFLFKS
ncbi:hypothetical protein LPJ64_001687 [Coemansia asiatica]|uniref:Uncharacterized protein n=1 Tax=Coemansia asiatica TaxID=1052880 RepID=A0A9W7XQ40_9FUNG|nr:hypothetical protein LPJ64_001687 [Coemansia asiatica]